MSIGRDKFDDIAVRAANLGFAFYARRRPWRLGPWISPGEGVGKTTNPAQRGLTGG